MKEWWQKIANYNLWKYVKNEFVQRLSTEKLFSSFSIYIYKCVCVCVCVYTNFQHRAECDTRSFLNFPTIRPVV